MSIFHNASTKSNINNPIQNLLKVSYTTRIVQLILSSYQQILIDKRLIGKKPKEPVRRNCLIHYMRQINAEQKLFYSIEAESETYDLDTFITLGRIDIKFALSYDPDYYYSIECKRFIKTNSGPKNIKCEYIDEGVARYLELKYSPKVNEAAMIAFVEEGKKNKLASNLCKEVNKVVKIGTSLSDKSSNYNHEYVYTSSHIRNNNTDIDIFHIILDFS